MTKKLKDKVVVITGASSGIGKACAFAFGQCGAHLVLAARSLEKLENIASELKSKGINVVVVKADVSDEQSCKSVISAAVNHFKKVDILINNAGISMRAAFVNADLDVLRKLMDVNFWGAVYCTKYALPYILESKGTVANISSVAGYRGLPGRTGYSASKFALQGFMEALRTEMYKKGVNVMTIAPGFTNSNIRNTALNDKGKAQAESPLDENELMSAEEVAEHILKAIVKRKRSLILTPLGKASVLVNKLWPSFMDFMVYRKMSREKDAPF